MAQRKTFTVRTAKAGLNLREAPSKDSAVLALLPNGKKVTILQAECPDGWVAVKGGGYCMKQFLE